ncbi:MAG: hypothetical protein J2P46_07700 [Zavarzinella sp.]|nr:hypothetical protein [Zavarzinella sp.]
MSDEVLRSLSWLGLAVGIVAVFMLLELLLRTLTNRFGPPQEKNHARRSGSQFPRVER